MLQTTMGGNRTWMGCLLSLRLEPETLHLPTALEGRGGGGTDFMPSQQLAETPALGMRVVTRSPPQGSLIWL